MTKNSFVVEVTFKCLLSPLPILYHLCYILYLHVLFMLWYIYVTLCYQTFIRYCHLSGIVS